MGWFLVIVLVFICLAYMANKPVTNKQKVSQEWVEKMAKEEDKLPNGCLTVGINLEQKPVGVELMKYALQKRRIMGGSQ